AAHRPLTYCELFSSRFAVVKVEDCTAWVYACVGATRPRPRTFKKTKRTAHLKQSTMGGTGSKGVSSSVTTPANVAKGTGASNCPLGHGKGKDADASDACDAEALAVPGSQVGNGKCPVQHSSGYTATAPLVSKEGDGKGEGGDIAGGGCPGKHGGTLSRYLNPHKYDVYNRRISEVDPSNQMPANPNQSPAPGQRGNLSTERVESTIPKGGTEGTWSYPSPQMFWNAITRKGKTEDTKEEDMDLVVAIHNNMNEKTWRQILKWEELRRPAGPVPEGGEPRLLRFLGRPDEMSLKARAKVALGHPAPFDRHDWVVDAGGQERRYIIDYYHDEGLSELDRVPELSSEDAICSIAVDVRPAPDSLGGLFDRFMRMPVYRRVRWIDFNPLPFFPPPTMRRQHQQHQQQIGNGQAGAGADRFAAVGEEELQDLVENMHAACSERLQALSSCEGEEQCGADAVRLTYCLATVACPKQAEAFQLCKAGLQGEGGTGSSAGAGVSPAAG
ncbi:unnamed protein product, partial [Discosporangium mesarthrocarpum]